MLSPAGEEQARLLQPLLNMFTFPGDKVYCTPLRRTLQTLKIGLANHPQKSRLAVVLLPGAMEQFDHFSDLPLVLD